MYSTQLGSSINKLAQYSYAKHSFLREWRVFILLTLVIKIAAMAFSIFAGYFYFKGLLTDILNNVLAAKIFAVVNLLLIESVTAILISKFFKFIIKGDLRTSVTVLFLVIGVFSVSFYSSTNGLALRQSKKVDKRWIIESEYSLEKEKMDTKFIDSQNEIKARIRTIEGNPLGWQGRKRTLLLSDQLLQIDIYHLQLLKLAKQHKKDLKELKKGYLLAKNSNRVVVNTAADKYYNIVAVIMCLIFLVNGLLMFFFSRVFDENKKDHVETEFIESFSEDIQSKASKVIENKFANIINMYFEAFKSTSLPILKKQKKTKEIGFSQIIEVGNICKNCGEVFEKGSSFNKFCSAECRQDFWKTK